MEDKQRITLVTLVGLPGSGKSTLCQELIKLNSRQDPDCSPTFLLLQYDSYVPLNVQSQFSQHPKSLAKILRTNFLRMITNFIQILKDGERPSESRLETGLSVEFNYILSVSTLISTLLNQLTILDFHSFKTDIIFLIDDNNYYKSMRNEVYQIAKSHDLGFCVLYPNTPLQVCQERNLQRNETDRIPSSVIMEMSKKLEEPDPMENPADILCLQVADVLDPSTHQMINDMLLHTLQNPIQPQLDNSAAIAKDKRICAESEVHQADLILRKWIHTELTLASFGIKKHELKKKVEDFQEKKSKVLLGLRSGEIQVMTTIGDEFMFRKEILALARTIKL